MLLSPSSACSKCSTSQRDVWMPTPSPCSANSAQAPAMPCNRSALSCASTSCLPSLMRHLLAAQVRGARYQSAPKVRLPHYLKEIEEKEGPATGTRVAVSEAIQDLVGRLAARINEEAEERVTQAQVKHAEQLTQHQQAAAALKTEAQST